MFEDLIIELTEERRTKLVVLMRRFVDEKELDLAKEDDAIRLAKTVLRTLQSHLGGMTWEDLPDTNCLYNYVEGGMDENEILQGCADFLNDRIQDSMD